jgi:hypothetical protein
VDIRGFKAFVLDNFRPDTPIFRVLASEKDELDDGEQRFDEANQALLPP